jgi:hypothetical protein
MQGSGVFLPENKNQKTPATRRALPDDAMPKRQKFFVPLVQIRTTSFV